MEWNHNAFSKIYNYTFIAIQSKIVDLNLNCICTSDIVQIEKLNYRRAAQIFRNFLSTNRYF